MNQVAKDWNVPGIGVGVVVDGKLVFAEGYGYRDGVELFASVKQSVAGVSPAPVA